MGEKPLFICCMQCACTFFCKMVPFAAKSCKTAQPKEDSLVNPIGHRFRDHLRRLFIIAHGDEGAMPQVPASVHSTNATWQTSFGVTHLSFLHLFRSQRLAPSRDPFLGQVFEWAADSSQLLESRKNFVPNPRYKPVLPLRDKDEPFVFVNAHEQCIKPVSTRNVTADYELTVSNVSSN